MAEPIKSNKKDETGLDFFKSSRSGNGGNCVEIALAQ